MPKIAIIPTFNENNIKEVLESVGFADELLVVIRLVPIKRWRLHDSILKLYNGNIKTQLLQKLGNSSYAQWILLVDADERVTPALRGEILQLIHQWSDATGGFLD